MVETVRLVHVSRWTASQPHKVTRPRGFLRVNKSRSNCGDPERLLRVQPVRCSARSGMQRLVNVRLEKDAQSTGQPPGGGPELATSRYAFHPLPVLRKSTRYVSCNFIAAWEPCGMYVVVAVPNS